MKRYYIDNHTGAGNFYADTLKEAMTAADEAAAYTQNDISIIDTDTNTEVFRRHWYGVKLDPETESDPKECIQFGEFGYYGSWTEL